MLYYLVWKIVLFLLILVRRGRRSLSAMANTKMWTLTGRCPVPFNPVLSFSAPSCSFQFFLVLSSPLLSFSVSSCPSQSPPVIWSNVSCHNFFLSLSSKPYAISLSSVVQPFILWFFVYFLKIDLYLSLTVSLHDSLFRFVNVKQQILAETNDNMPWQSIFNTIFFSKVWRDSV